jgi:cobalt/nickel transport system permease protein
MTASSVVRVPRPAGPFDRYVKGASLLHELDPRAKLVAALACITSNIALPDGSWAAFAATWALLLVGSAASGLGISYAVRRSFVALPFALAAITALFVLPGTPLFVLDFGPWHLVATDAGLVRFGSILTRTWLSVQVGILLVATTSIPDLLHALRHLHVSALLVSIVAMMYRYLAVMADEATRLIRARDARSVGPGGSLAWRGRVTGHMAGQLFLRSYDRGDRIYAAMLARGYDGETRSLVHKPMRAADWRFLLELGVLLLALQGAARAW